MSTSVLNPFRTLPANLPDSFRLKMRLEFSSTGPDPGAFELGRNEYSLGTDSDWNPELHDLSLKFILKNLGELGSLFDTGGVAASDAVLLLALEWTSPDSGWRKLGPPFRFSGTHLPPIDDHVELSVELAAGSIRGTGILALQVFLDDPGSGDSGDAGIAQQKGMRIGTLSDSICIVIDGDGSLFPVQEEGLGRDGALWEMRIAWNDPREEPFASEYVALVLNPDHAMYGELRGRGIGQGGQTSLMQHVLSSWVSLLVYEVKEELGEDFDNIVVSQVNAIEFASIAEAAAAMVRSGELDTSSAHSLFASTQRWLGRRVREATK
jgi:hypothetical protein